MCRQDLIVCDERGGYGGFMLLARRQLDVERAAFAIYDHVEVGGKTST
jgi:hypothetical protein